MRFPVLIVITAAVLLQLATAVVTLRSSMENAGKLRYDGLGFLHCEGCSAQLRRDENVRTPVADMVIDLNECIQNTYGQLTWMSPGQ